MYSNKSPRRIDRRAGARNKKITKPLYLKPCYLGEIEEQKNKKSLKENDLISHCKKLLGDFKSPSKIHFFNVLPKGSSGKIQRLKIKDLIHK